MEMVAKYIEGVNSHSGYIYYRASDEEVKKFQSKLDILNIAESSQAAHEVTHEAQRMIIKSISEVKDTNIGTKVELKKYVEEAVTKELGELRELVQLLVRRADGEYSEPSHSL